MCIKINLVLSNKMDFRINDFKKCYTSVVHDVMRSKGFRNFTLPNNIRPIETDYRICDILFSPLYSETYLYEFHLYWKVRRFDISLSNY